MKKSKRYELAHINIAGRRDTMKGIYDNEKNEIIARFNTELHNIYLANTLIDLANDNNCIIKKNKGKHFHKYEVEPIGGFDILEEKRSSGKSRSIMMCDTLKEATQMADFLDTYNIRLVWRD